MSYSPNYELILAPKENSYHLKFSSFTQALKTVVLSSKSEEDVLENYYFLKNYIETYDFSNPKKNTKGEDITDVDGLVSFLLETFTFVSWIGIDNYFSYSYPENKNFGTNISVCVFSIYYDTENKIKCTYYNTASTKLHNTELNYCGEVNTNNKTSKWSWDVDSNNYSDLFYTVSLWFEEKIFNIFDTTKTSFVFSDYLSLDEGLFELIVVTKDKSGACSDPAYYKFKLKTSFTVANIKVEMIDDEGNKIDISTKTNPTFRIYNFNSSYNYILNFDNLYKFSYKEALASGTNLFSVNNAENALEFKYPDKFISGSHNLNITVMDEINNTFGDDILSPEGIHGSHFYFFYIAASQSENPELISYMWQDNGSLLISWKSDQFSKSFDLFQGNTFLANTIETICELEPMIYKKNEVVITIIPYGYDGSPSNNTLSVSVKKPIQTISSFNISLKDAIILDDKSYTNNPCPTFSWNTTFSTSSIANYMCSLDGSNWFGINTSEYTFQKLKDGDYTFRLKAIFLDKTYTQPDLNTFNFTVKTTLPSYPVFSKETLNNTETTFEKLFFSWAEISDTSYYELSFNDGQYIKQVYSSTSYCPFYDKNNSVYAIPLRTGWNTLTLSSVSKYGNKSKGTKLSFLINKNNEPAFSPFYYAPISYEKFHSLNVSLNNNETGYRYLIKDPDKDVFEDYTDTSKKYFRNSKPFVKNGIYTYEVFLNDEPVIPTFNYTFNSFSFSFNNLYFDNEFVRWEINNNDIAPKFEYSLALQDSDCFIWNTTLAKQTPSLKLLAPGVYKFKIKAYSFDGTLQEEKELLNIFIAEKELFSELLVPILGLQDLKLNCLFYKKSNSFVVLSVFDFNNEEVNCFLQYKTSDEDVYQLYSFDKKPLLSTKGIYDFIINKIS